MIKVMISITEGYDKIKIYLLSAVTLIYHILNIIPSKDKNSKSVHITRKLLDIT